MSAPGSPLAPPFAHAMAMLGPFEPSPSLAAAVSGGPDSLALALLARDWVRARSGALLALIVDHGLRPESAAEAQAVASQLESLDIRARILPLYGLPPGPALSERARAARFAALEQACAAAGILHLLLGHHAADQAETVIIRALASSGPAGLAGMAALVVGKGVRLLRPLLGLPPGALKDFLRQQGLGWVDDPSNNSQTAQRGRIRLLRADAAGTGAATQALAAAAQAAAMARAGGEQAAADWVARHALLNPAGFSLLPPGPWPEVAFAHVLRMLAGRAHLPPSAAIARLAATPRPATLAGAIILPAGRLGPGWLLAREAAAMTPAIPALPGAIWDRRFRLAPHASLPAGCFLGALGADAARLRRLSPLPARILATLPALRNGETLFAVPHLGYPDADHCARAPVWFDPPLAAFGPGFVATGRAETGE